MSNPNCPICDRELNKVNDRKRFKNGEPEAYYLCKNKHDKHYFFKSEISTLNSGAKILTMDIETSPFGALVWRRWKQNIYLPQTLFEPFILTWAAKWICSDKVISNRLTPEEALARDDKRIVKNLKKLLDEADIVIAHNGDSFDMPWINGRCCIHGIEPISPYQTIDTKKIAAKQFNFTSNKLDALAGYFGLGCKIDTDFELWGESIKGNKKALKEMEIYNQQDVSLLEDVYFHIRPYVNSHPNLALYNDVTTSQCAHCGSDNVKETNPYYTPVGKYKAFRCNNCGAINRGKYNTIGVKKNKQLLRSTAR